MPSAPVQERAPSISCGIPVLLAVLVVATQMEGGLCTRLHLNLIGNFTKSVLNKWNSYQLAGGSGGGGGRMMSLFYSMLMRCILFEDCTYIWRICGALIRNKLATEDISKNINPNCNPLQKHIWILIFHVQLFLFILPMIPQLD